MALLLLLLSILSISNTAAAVVTTQSTAAASCPLNLSYVNTFPWDSTPCTSTAGGNISSCCVTLLSLYGISFSFRLRSTSHFRLPDPSTSAACLSSFQSHLSSLSLPNNLVSSCFPSPQRFVITPHFCAGIQNLADWNAKLPSTSNRAIAAGCGGVLDATTGCSRCVTAGLQISSQLTSLDGNASHATNCFYLTVVYASAIANSLSPDDPRSAACIFSLALSSPPVATPSSSSKYRRTAAIAAGSSAAALLSVSCFLCWLWFSRRKKRKPHQLMRRRPHQRPNIGSIWFDFKDLERATSNFSEANLIGRGGFGAVYKGVLADGTEVAVKKILEEYEFGDEEEFMNEVLIISELRHRNLLSLRGCCITEQQRLLVYDYMPNGSLDRHIFTSNNGRALTWQQRRSIVLDVARGLEYLHYGVKPGIYHRDIKATNILLDEEMRARVADFGLARRTKEGQSHLTTEQVAGTHGYLAPEYALYGQLTKKSDVYSFGVLVLEIMSGRKALLVSSAPPSTVTPVADWAWSLVKTGKAAEVLDECLLSESEGNASIRMMMERFARVGILSAHPTADSRPSISEALKMLEGGVDVPEILDWPLSRGGAEEGGVFTDSAINNRVMLV